MLSLDYQMTHTHLYVIDIWPTSHWILNTSLADVQSWDPICGELPWAYAGQRDLCFALGKCLAKLCRIFIGMKCLWHHLVNSSWWKQGWGLWAALVLWSFLPVHCAALGTLLAIPSWCLSCSRWAQGGQGLCVMRTAPGCTGRYLCCCANLHPSVPSLQEQHVPCQALFSGGVTACPKAAASK